VLAGRRRGEMREGRQSPGLKKRGRTVGEKGRAGQTKTECSSRHCGKKGCGGQTQAAGGSSHHNGGGQTAGGQPAAPIASCSGTEPFMGPISAMPASSSCWKNQWMGEWAGLPGCNQSTLWGRVLNEQQNEGQNHTWAGREQGRAVSG